ncbi:MAG: TIGR03016 family PEP-CTERM system-associated outer membrane protein [Burkholderiales bacterium]|nr:TIGR03016 family PEP-CTERM system-associated outer membrane protein [Burkholderiales bacterium]
MATMPPEHHHVARPRIAILPVALATWCAVSTLNFAVAAPPLPQIPSAPPQVEPQADQDGITAATQAQARAWRIEPGVELTGTATSNSGYASNQKGPADEIFVISPSLSIAGNGPNMRVNGKFQFDAIKYARGTQPDRILPQGTLDAEFNLIERLMGLDMGLTTLQTSADPFSAQSDGGPSTVGRYTTTQARISPYLERSLTPELLLKARAEATHTNFATAGSGLLDRPDAHTQHHTLSLDRKPTRIGAAIELDYQKSGYDQQPTSELTQQSGRGLLSYAVTDQFTFSGIAGRESNQTVISSRSDSLYGGRIDWNPNERTHLLTTLEHHFFGPAWDVSLSHNAPTYASRITLNKTLTTSANALSSLTTPLIPGTPAPQTAPTLDSFTLSAQLRQSVSARFAIMGRRDTVSVVIDVLKTTPRQLIAEPLTEAPNLQRAIEFQYDHRMTRQTTLEAAVRWSRTSTPGTSLESTENSIRAGVNTRLSPQTTATIGVRQLRLNSNVLSTNPRELALFAGLGHRF